MKKLKKMKISDKRLFNSLKNETSPLDENMLEYIKNKILNNYIKEMVNKGKVAE